MAQLKPITKSDYLVTLVTDANVSGGTETNASTSTDTVAKNIWTSCSAFKFSNATSKYNDGQSYIMRTVTGPTEYDNMTLSRPFDPAQHGDFFQVMEEVQEQGKVFTLTITPGKKTSTGEGFVPHSPGRKITLLNCELVSFSVYAADGTSGEADMMELEIAPNGHSIEGVTVTQTSGSVDQNISPDKTNSNSGSPL